MKKYKFLASLVLATVLLFSGTLAQAQAIPANNICSIIVLLGQLNVITPQQIITLNNALGCGNTPQPPGLPPGCTSTSGFSPTTGQSCGGGSTPDLASFSIVSPNRDTIWRNDTAGEWLTIKWKYAPGSIDGSARVRVDLVGTRYGLASGQRVDEGQVRINISPDIQPGRYQIKISDFDNGKIFAYSDYFTVTSGGTTGNRPPVVSGVSGPTVLRVGETGTWSVRASDPENQSLSYSVLWGDENLLAYSVAGPRTVSQSATFTHSYATPGNYSPNFTVTDSFGQSARTSLSVQVGGGNTPIPAPTVLLNVNGHVATGYDSPSVNIGSISTAVINWSSTPNATRCNTYGQGSLRLTDGTMWDFYNLPVSGSRTFQTSGQIDGLGNTITAATIGIQCWSNDFASSDSKGLVVSWSGGSTPPPPPLPTPQSSTISVERPRSGDNWRLGENREITWEDSGSTGFNYKVYVRGDSPASAYQLIGQTATNKLRWTVGPGGQFPVGSYRVEVIKDDGLGYNKNLSGQFTISSGGHASIYNEGQMANISSSIRSLLQLFGR
ncbi:hypothetical protein IT398_01540 [Candidatus Nomurabacteria bacterium]|nr:hypothetical protein [Candidatus Nomurabacteria bacterium]